VLSRFKPALFIQQNNFELAFYFLRIDTAMPSRNLRLHIVLYVRGNKNPYGEDNYYWALLVIPKSENEGTDPAQKRYHVTNTEPVLGHRLPPWHSNMIPVSCKYKPKYSTLSVCAFLVDLCCKLHPTIPLKGVRTSRLLVRITVAKVENPAHVERTPSRVA